MEAFHLFIVRYPHVGGMTIESIVGEYIDGTTSEYLTNRFNRTGATGKKTGIGRSTIRGVSKVLSPERNHNNLVTTTVIAKIRIAKIRTTKIRTVVTMTAETVDRERLQANPQQGKPERGGKNNGIESRMKKSLSHYEKAAISIQKICRVGQANYWMLQ
jgi:hypothetical protein